MSQAGSQAWAFYREVAVSRVMWTVEDDVGYPQPMTADGYRAQPFWSSRSRVEKIVATVPAYSVFRPAEVSWDEFCREWVPDLTRSGVRVGVNWSGQRATGYDIEPEQVQRNVQAVIDNPQ